MPARAGAPLMPRQSASSTFCTALSVKQVEAPETKPMLRRRTLTAVRIVSVLSVAAQTMASDPVVRSHAPKNRGHSSGSSCCCQTVPSATLPCWVRGRHRGVDMVERHHRGFTPA